MLQLSSGKYELKAVIENVINKHAEEIKSKPIMVEIIVDSDVHEIMEWDYMYFGKMLGSLIDNAARHMSIGVLSICISEKVDFDGDTFLKVQVKDTGDGISEDERMQLENIYKDVSLNVDTIEGVGTLCEFQIACKPVGDELAGTMQEITRDFYVPMNRKTAVKKNSTTDTAENVSPVSSIDTSGLPEIPDINWEYAVMLSQSPEISLFTAKTFYKSLDKEIAELKTLYGDIFQNGVEDYRIRVHGLKGATATFGAMQISGLARLLEFAAREKDINRINVLHPILMSELFRIKNEWSALKDEHVVQSVCEDKALLKEKLEELKAAMNRLDVDAADAVMECLGKLSFGKTIDDSIEELGKAVMSIDDESAISICNHIMEVL